MHGYILMGSGCNNFENFLTEKRTQMKESSFM